MSNQKMNRDTLPRVPRIRLGVDFHVWDGIFQGSRSHLLGLYRAAIRMGPDIDFVFFLGNPSSLLKAHAEFGAPNVTLVAMKHSSALFRLAVQLPWLQWRHRLHMLHMQYRLPFLRLGACAVTVHDLLFETHPQFFKPSFVLQSRITYRLAVARAKLLFAVSQFSKTELSRLYGVAPGRVAVTYNGVDRSVFRPGPDGAQQVRDLGLVPGQYILTVGRLEPRKNHQTLIEAYSSLPAEAPPLVIVGQRDFSYEAMFAAIQRHGLAARVKIIESVGDNALPAVMRHATMFVYPAYAEGFGMPVAEAMASGVPVVTSNTTSLPEVAGQGALLVDPTSAPDLSQAMNRLLTDRPLRDRLLVEAAKQVMKFDWDQSANTFLDALRANVFVPRS